jgi:hypothetical protein
MQRPEPIESNTQKKELPGDNERGTDASPRQLIAVLLLPPSGRTLVFKTSPFTRTPHCEIICCVGTSEPTEQEVDEPFNGAELSESVLAGDWNSPEEEAAWSNL